MYNTLNKDTTSHIFTFLRVDEIARIARTCRLFNIASKNPYTYLFNSVYANSYPTKELWSKSKKIRWLKRTLPSFPLLCRQLFVGYFGNVSVIKMCPRLERLVLSRVCFEPNNVYKGVNFLCIKELIAKYKYVDLSKHFPDLEELNIEKIVIKNTINFSFLKFPTHLRVLNIIDVNLECIIPQKLDNLKVIYTSDIIFNEYIRGENLEEIYILTNEDIPSNFWNNFPRLKTHCIWKRFN